MSARKQRTKAQKLEVGKNICDQYAKGEHTIVSICDMYGVSYDTFRNWVKEGNAGYMPEVAKLYKKSLEDSEVNFKLLMKNEARHSLLRKIRYDEYVEEHKEGRRSKPDEAGKTKMEIHSIRTVKKLYVPDTTALIFTLKNLDKENFSDAIQIEDSTHKEMAELMKKSRDELKDLLEQEEEELAKLSVVSTPKGKKKSA